MKPFNNFWHHLFSFGSLFVWTRFHSVGIFIGFIELLRVTSFTCVPYFTCVITFNAWLVSNMLGVTYECYIIKHFGYYNCSLIARIIYIIRV